MWRDVNAQDFYVHLLLQAKAVDILNLVPGLERDYQGRPPFHGGCF